MGVEGAFGTEDVGSADGAAGSVDVGRIVRAGQRGAKVRNGLVDVDATA